jgi:hypothetical protein
MNILSHWLIGWICVLLSMIQFHRVMWSSTKEGMLTCSYGIVREWFDFHSFSSKSVGKVVEKQQVFPLVSGLDKELHCKPYFTNIIWYQFISEVEPNYHKPFRNHTQYFIVDPLYLYAWLSLLWWYGSWIYNYLCNQCLSPLTLSVRIPLRRGVFDTTLCDKVCQWLATGQWFSLGTPVSSTTKTDCHNVIYEILLKVALSIIKAFVKYLLQIFLCSLIWTS